MNLPIQETMTPLDVLPPELQEELSQILEDYLADLERGVQRDSEALIAQHPKLASSLRPYLDSLDLLHRAAAEMGAESAAGALDEVPHKELGDYKILGEVGRGGMGVVYEAEQISLGRRVALKVLPFAAVLDQKQIARFNNEAQAAAQLNHPHIVPVYSVGCERGVHYYSMQFIEGRPLDRVITELRTWAGQGIAEDVVSALDDCGPDSNCEPGTADPAISGIHSSTSPTDAGFSTARSVKSRGHVRTATELAIQAAEAIQHAHDYGIVHRDIKPSNLLVDWQGKLWVTDFGLARFQTDSNLTMTGDLLGTARYMSPEQASGRGHLVDHRSDVFSLGITFYELLTLRHPFDASDRNTLLRQIEHDDPVPPRRVNDAIPVDLETILLKAISKSRDDRYESAQAMADDLRRFLDGKPTLATRPTMLDRSVKWAGRHQTFVTTALGAMLFALVGTSIAALMISQAQNETESALLESKANYAQSQENLRLISEEKDKTRLAFLESKEHLAQSQKNLRQAREVVDRFGIQLANQMVDMPGLEGLRQSLLEETLRYYEGFVQQSQEDPALRLNLAVSYSKIASMRGHLGAIDEALAAYAKAERLFLALIAEYPVGHPEVERIQSDFAMCLNNVGNLLVQQGKVDAAREAYTRAITTQRRLVALQPTDVDHQSALAMTLTSLGSFQRKTNQPDQAMRSYQEAVKLQERLAQDYPDVARLQARLAGSYNDLSFLCGMRGLPQAEQYNRKALEIYRQLTEQNPTALKPLAGLATCYNNRGAIFKRVGRLDDARLAYQNAAALQMQLVQRAPTMIFYQYELGVTYNNLGQVLASSSPRKAEASFQKAEKLFTKLIDASPKFRASLGGVLNNLGLLWEQAGQLDKAVAAYRLAIQQQEQAYRQAMQLIEFRTLLSITYVNYGRVLRRQEKPIAAGEVAMKRKALWKGAGQRLVRVAAELAEAARMLAEASGPENRNLEIGEGLKKKESASERLANEAVSTLAEAVDAGFQDSSQLTDHGTFVVVSDNPRFQALLAKMTARSQPTQNRQP